MSAETQKIPKIIHYCWFGQGPKPELVLKCIDSWKQVMPDYEIREWNENNFDVHSHPYSTLAHRQKKWAFVSDVARLHALEHYGGIYLDTDMYVLKPFNDFLNYDLVLGKEDEYYISAGMIACGLHNSYIEKMNEYYKTQNSLVPIPKLLTEVYTKTKDKEMKTKIFDSIYFYPFTAETIKQFDYTNASIESYAVHLWNYSWGHPLNKFIKKIGLYSTLKKITEKIGVKKIIKNILRME